MATNFGFMPVLTGKRYFISYKSEDSERVGEITRRLNQMGVPMWYDYGIEKGELWSREINRNIQESEAIVLFASKTLFAYEDTYVRKEFRLANVFSKKIFIVWLDNVTTRDVNNQIMDWYLDVTDLQGIEVIEQNAEQVAWSIVTEFHLINGMSSQPQSPAYQKTTSIPSTASRNTVQVGRVVTFGQYPQGANGEIQPLEWRVLAVENGKALLVTDKLIDYIQYNKTYTSVTWENCSLRKWMNSEFFNKAFNSDQKTQIEIITNKNPNSPKYRTQGGNATQDKIFALSIDEVKKYCSSASDKEAYTTDYAHKQGHDQKDRSERWWLRSPGLDNFNAATVDISGLINQYGDDEVTKRNVAVRPALWLNLS